MTTTTLDAVRARLAEMRERVEKATPGPWEWWEGNPWHALAPKHRLRKAGENAPDVFTTGNAGNGFFFREGVQAQAKQDTAFIAAARTDLPDCIALIESLLAEREALEEFNAGDWTREIERNLDEAERKSDAALSRFVGRKIKSV